jgi:hypothetical protein
VLACSQARGGVRHAAIARPTAAVDSTRESMIARRFAAVYRQLTERPARLITASAPSSSFAQAPTFDPSHATSPDFGFLLSTVTSCPSAPNARARICPT